MNLSTTVGSCQSLTSTSNRSIMDSDGNKLHVVMFPWLGFGHMIPFLELAKSIAVRGHKVSFISTPRNIQRLPRLPPNLATHIHFVPLTLPNVHGLPHNAEATMDVRGDQIQYLKIAFDGLETDLTRFLYNSSPDWILHDFLPYWLLPIAAKLNISCAFFSIINAWFIGFFGPTSGLIDGSHPRTEPEHFTVPPEWVRFPTKVAYRLHETPFIMGAFEPNELGVSDMYRVGMTYAGIDAFFMRHCEEFEPEWLNVLRELYGKPVIPVGLMPPTVQDSGEERNEAWVSISELLGKQKKGSVVYVALGSEVTLSQEQLTELALGLEQSGLPFFWALRKPPGLDESDSVELPVGFEERTRGRGVIWTGWAPQLRVLGHDSVGGFLTHCGWSSIIEGLKFGLPLIMLPFVVDQGLNARVFEDKKVGIEIPRDERDGSFTRNSVAESVRLVMVDGEGTIYRDNAWEMKKIFGDKEGQDRYIEPFLEFLEKHRRVLEDS
ncbi:putative UDP-rhamnose:rhamnosyltransferase 1 [Cornus florida]|uniref:putative UDP-rhamnose:rhamnosyltransferase 1 n=1 Tax=Cornus florida TaxID=4283 RepID=UPI002897CA50|nr:putative UDP-rhamnose:rhamnosyltransferase 1 [Cornus florida]